METLFWKHLTKISRVDKLKSKNREPKMLLLPIPFSLLTYESAFKKLMKSVPSINTERSFKPQL